MKPNTQTPVVISRKNKMPEPSPEALEKGNRRRKIEQLREEQELNAQIADYPESNTALDELAKQAQELNMGY